MDAAIPVPLRAPFERRVNECVFLKRRQQRRHLLSRERERRTIGTWLT